MLACTAWGTADGAASFKVILREEKSLSISKSAHFAIGKTTHMGRENW
jgi:hypothetical protein